jgi:hypothetical protein
MHFELMSPTPVVQEVDPKAKKDPKAPNRVDFTEEEETKFENRIMYQIGDSTLIEEPQVISFALKCCY